jgi:hypothetical protein
VEELELCDMSEREKRGKSIRMFAGADIVARDEKWSTYV